MQIDFFCVAEKIEINSDNTPAIHGLIDNIAAPQFPVTVPCMMCCIVGGTKDERPESFALSFTLENELGELLMSLSIGVRSTHLFDEGKPLPLHNLHVLPPTNLVFKSPGTYTARVTLENGDSMEQPITVFLQS